ncbi:MAG: TraB/GumN family protein [Pararobbsia sp.]
MAQVVAPSAGDAAPVWTATAAGRPTLLLLPTIHALTTDDPRIDKRLAQVAGRVQGRCAGSADGMGQTGTVRPAAIWPLWSGGQPDESRRDPLTAEELARCARLSDQEIVPFLQLKPWLAALAVNELRMAGHAAKQNPHAKPVVALAGIDMRLLDIAQKNNMPVIFLETVEQGLKLFDDMPPDEQDAYLHSACTDLTGRAPGDVDIGDLERAWLDSDMVRLEQLATTRDPACESITGQCKPSHHRQGHP